MRLLFVIIVLLILAPLAEARPIAPVEGLEALRKAFAGIDDFTAELTQEKRLSVMKRTLTMNGIVRFKKPDLFYLEFTAPYASRMVLRDTVLEQVTGTGERNRMMLPPDQGLKRWFDKIATPVTAVPEGMTVQADLTGTVYTVTLHPGGNGQMKEIGVAFQGDGVMRRLVLVERNGDRTVMTFRKVRRNTGQSEKNFQLD